jgi:hypothetical protein
MVAVSCITYICLRALELSYCKDLCTMSIKRRTYVIAEQQFPGSVNTVTLYHSMSQTRHGDLEKGGDPGMCYLSLWARPH